VPKSPWAVSQRIIDEKELANGLFWSASNDCDVLAAVLPGALLVSYCR